MRAAKLIILPACLALGTACSSSWELILDAEGTCEPRPFFFDEDQDGWGVEDAEHPRQELCLADDANLYTARNARDCDDSTNTITGRVGSVCPCDVTTGNVDDYSTCADGVGFGGTDYVGWIGAETEFLAILPPTDTIWPVHARTACELGWGHPTADGAAGAWLATFNEGEVADMQAAFAGVGVTDYAGFVGISTTDGGDWAWEDGATSAVSSITPCAGSLPDVDRVTDEQQLAVVFRDVDPKTCLGTPANAAGYDHDTIPDLGLSPQFYAPLFGHFVCERPIPDPDNYWEPPAAADAPTE